VLDSIKALQQCNPLANGCWPSAVAMAELFCRTTKLKRFDGAGLYVNTECGLIFDVSIGFKDLMIVDFIRWN